MYLGRKIRVPYFGVNPKSYIYGHEALELAIAVDALAAKYDVDVFFTAQLVDIPAIVAHTHNLIIGAQHMDGIYPGRGMGKVLPEALKEAGVQAITLNHAENPLTLSELTKAQTRADELGLITFICANSLMDAKAAAEMAPNIIICEQDGLIATGKTAELSYMRETTAAIKKINPDILVNQAAGISSGEDVYKALMAGSDGTGATSSIMNAPDRAGKVEEMLRGLARARNEMRENGCIQ